MTGWWPGDGTGTDILNGRNATLDNGATYATGLVGQAFQFDGVDDDASVASDPALNVGTGDFTVDFWVNLTAPGGEEVMVEKWDETGNSGNGSGWTISNRGGLYYAGSNSSIQTSAQIPTGMWTHIALRRSSGTAALFLNGSQVGSASGTDNFDTNTPMLFGRRHGGQGFFWNGRIDEVHYFVGTALSDAQIQAIFNAGSNGLCENVTCGNSMLDPGEQCDDGNHTDGDGCDSNCTFTGCGNGIVTAGEACDDGNLSNNDACKNDCTPNVCGDGVVYTGVEQCDDGNHINGDGCDSNCTISGSCVPVPSGLTAWWPGDGSGADILNGRNATLENGATYATGLVGQAFQFDGVDDDASVANDPALNVGTGDFTVDFWVNPAVPPATEVMVEKWDETGNSGNGSGWTIANRGGLFYAGSNSAIQTSAQIPAGMWTHIALRRSSGTVALFLNGSQVGSASGTGNFDTTSPMLFGRRHGGQGFFWNGRIDEVHYFVGTALSDAQIQAIYNAGSNGLCENVTCGNSMPDPGEQCDDGNHTDGDGCDSNCTFTACGNGIITAGEVCDDGNASNNDACKNDCTPNVCGDGVVYTGVEQCDDGNLLDGDGCDSDCTVSGPCAAVPAGLTAWWTGDGGGADIEGGYDAALKNGAGFAAGKVRQAFSLDGVNDFVNVEDNAALDVGSGDFTVDLWAYFNTTADEQVLIEKYVETYGEFTTGWTLTKLSNNVVRFAGAGGQSVDSSRLNLSANTWIHFAARRSAGTVALFLNGTKVGEDMLAGDLSSPSSLKFGHRGGPNDTPGSVDTRGFYLNGRIDEVHLVVGRALSDAEIQAIVTANHSGLCVPTPVCGNGLVEAGEACDDGNMTNGDGCENDCTLSCGNGVVDTNEECDDGNHIDGDGCDNNCTVSRCGNGIVAGSESCEDGNTVNGDGCDNNCTVTACGNGIVTAGEACDDGNAVDGDGCESDCTLTPVSGTAMPGGTVGTLAASPQNPIQTTITTPTGGMISIASSNTPLTPDGVQALVNSLLIQAPPATAEAPLTIAIRIDASVIPPGVDLLHVDLTRDGVLLENCTGTPGTADPDPCIESRVLEMDGDVTITGLTSHASTWAAVARGLFANEQTCVDGVSKDGLKVGKAQGKVDASCLKGAAEGAVADPQACLTADSRQKVAKSIQKTSALAAERCTPSPPFGFSDANSLTDAAQQAALELMADIFGSNLDGAVATDKSGASCQAGVLKGAQKLFVMTTQLFLACEKAGLAGDGRLFVSSAQLAACFDDLTTTAKLLKSVTKLGKTISTKCPGNRATLLPGPCGASINVAYCLETHVECRACQMLTAFTGVARDCDAFDDGIDNNSCN